jgi:hypothetical protein
MGEFSGAGVASSYLIAVFLFLSCALLFICSKKADEANRERSSKELDDAANTNVINYDRSAGALRTGPSGPLSQDRSS